MKRISKHATTLGLLLVCLHVSMAPGAAQSTITTYAGGGTPLVSGAPAITQNIDRPASVASDGAGGFYFTTAGPSHRVFRVAANGALTIVAGNGAAGFSGDGGPATAAGLNYPAGVAVDGSGNVFIADSNNRRIRKVDSNGIISTVAGNGSAGFNRDGGPATAATLSYPGGVAVDGSGNLFIADSANHRIRKVDSNGNISTVAGNGMTGFGGDGNIATSAFLAYPNGIAVDGSGNVLIADSENYRIRKVTPAGIISTVAGNGSEGFGGDGGPAVSTGIDYPIAIAVDTAGSFFIANYYDSRIRKVTANGVISTVAGTDTSGFSGDGGPAASARLDSPSGIGVDGSGNLFIADSENFRIRKVTPAGVISTAAGIGKFAGDGGPAVSALLSYPSGVAADAAGNIFIADFHNHRVRKITPAGIISTFAGNGTAGFSGDGGPATLAQLHEPASVAVNVAGEVFIADCAGPIRKVSSTGVITTIADHGAGGVCNWYGGPVVSAAIAADAAGNVFVAEANSHRVRKVTSNGIISTVTGTGTLGFSGDGGPAIAARLNSPSGVAVDAAGTLFIADRNNSRIRKVTSSGIISTVAGNGAAGFSGDGGPATSARLNFPSGVAVDGSGNVFIADSQNFRIRKVTLSGTISTVAGGGALDISGHEGLPAVSVKLETLFGVAVDAVGVLYVLDTYSHRILRVGFATPPALTGVFRDFGAQGASVNVTLAGTNFFSPLTIGAGTGITASDITVVTEILATATLTINSNTTLGARSLTVATGLGTSGAVPFIVVPPFPDLSITSSHVGNLAAGLSGAYAVDIVNVGTAATTGALTLTDTLPPGLTFVSGGGSGWSCAASGQTVTCANLETLAAGASTTLTLTVAVDDNVGSSVVHAPVVAAAGDLIPSNDIALDATSVANLRAPILKITPLLVAGRQSSLGVTLPVAFPVDVSGTLKLAFLPDPAISADDPTIQFATGGREVAFTIPAHSVVARFSANPLAGPIGFQPGTVAGTLTFSGTLQAGTTHSTFSTAQSIPRQAPSIQAVGTDTRNGFAAVVTLLSSTREISELILQFDTTPSVRLSCAAAPDCVVLGSALTFNVKPAFDAWFAGDSVLGSLSAMRLPLSIQGNVHGKVWIALRNSLGYSNWMSFQLP